jgi:hypothetical protein
MAYFRVSPLGASRDETWWGQGIRKRFVTWNLSKLSQLWRCNKGFRPSNPQNDLRTKQLVSGTKNLLKVNCVFCLILLRSLLIFFVEPTVTGVKCLDMLQLWLIHRHYRKIAKTSFSNKTEPRRTSILTSVLTSVLIFPVVVLGAILTMILIFFPGLHGHLT